MLFYMFRK